MFVLEDLWIGNIQPNENTPISKNYTKAITLLVEKETALSDRLPDEEGRKLLEEFEGCQSDMVYWAEIRAFTEGFRLGGKIIMDLFDIKQ